MEHPPKTTSTLRLQDSADLGVAGALGPTTQTSVDTQSWQTQAYVPRNHYQRLDLFRKSYEEVALLHQAIEALVLLTNGDLAGVSGDSGVDEETLDILARMNYHAVLDCSLRQYFTYGFSLDEIVWSSDFREIVKVATVDSRTVYCRKAATGEISDYLQIPPIPLMRGSRDRHIPYAIRIPNDRVMYDCRSPLGDNVYGVSLLQPIVQSGLPRTLQIIEQSKGIIYRKLAANPMHVNVNPSDKYRLQKAEARKYADDRAPRTRVSEAELGKEAWTG